VSDDRRAQLLARGAELFARHAYDDLTMAEIARAAGISKALLYHYFPSKQAFFLATLEETTGELRRIVEADPDLPPVERLARSLDAFLAWVEAHAEAYATLMRSAGEAPELGAAVERARDAAAERVLAGVAPDRTTHPPAQRAAVRGWLGFVEGVLADWLAHRDLDRERLRALLLGTLLGAVTAAGSPRRR
jgi:AcrR family transcriptional regulator